MIVSITITSGEKVVFEDVVGFNQPTHLDVEIVYKCKGRNVSLSIPWAIIEDIHEVERENEP